MASKVAGSMAKPSRAAKRIGAQQPQMVFAEARAGVADGAHEAALPGPRRPPT